MFSSFFWYIPQIVLFGIYSCRLHDEKDQKSDFSFFSRLDFWQLLAILLKVFIYLREKTWNSALLLWIESPTVRLASSRVRFLKNIKTLMILFSFGLNLWMQMALSSIQVRLSSILWLRLSKSQLHRFMGEIKKHSGKLQKFWSKSTRTIFLGLSLTPDVRAILWWNADDDLICCVIVTALLRRSSDFRKE